MPVSLLTAYFIHWNEMKYLPTSMLIYIIPSLLNASEFLYISTT